MPSSRVRRVSLHAMQRGFGARFTYRVRRTMPLYLLRMLRGISWSEVTLGIPRTGGESEQQRPPV